MEIKYNNDVLYQSKLINYFNGDYSKSKIEKDVNNFLKKIKKNKRYSFSKKDVIFLESLKADGIEDTVTRYRYDFKAHCVLNPEEIKANWHEDCVFFLR